MTTNPSVPDGKRVLLLGASGTIGRATLPALLNQGHDVVCFGRNRGEGAFSRPVEWRTGDVTNPTSIARDAFRGERFDAVVSCLASRTGAPKDAWAIDHGAHMKVLEAAKDHGVKHFVLLSAICVQRPKLEFQRAKLAFENALVTSGLTYSIVRPTAYFKSLSGQIERVKQGKPFLVFGDGKLTACKPISDGDLGTYIAGCLDKADRANRILPIGGRSSAMTPLDLAHGLSDLMGREVKVRRVPVLLMDMIITATSAIGIILPSFRDKAEFARTGKYYATESMLVWNEETARYDADATPSFGDDHLFDYYRAVLAGEVEVNLGDHAVF